jgi:hypothetical protein
MPKLIGCTARTLLFDDGSELTVPPYFDDSTRHDLPWDSVFVRHPRGAAILIIGWEREQVEEMITHFIDEVVNRVEQGEGGPSAGSCFLPARGRA